MSIRSSSTAVWTKFSHGFVTVIFINRLINHRFEIMDQIYV